MGNTLSLSTKLEPLHLDTYTKLPAVHLRSKYSESYSPVPIEKKLCLSCASVTSYLPPFDTSNRDRCRTVADDNLGMVIVADGCGLYLNAERAADIAATSFEKAVWGDRQNWKTIRDVGKSLYNGVFAANDAVLAASPEEGTAGSTTLSGAVLCGIKPAGAGLPQWAFVCVNVGDCQVFKRNDEDRIVFKISMDERPNPSDPTRPGGWIGDYNNNIAESIHLYFIPAYPGDSFFVMTDGITDNITPNDMQAESMRVDLTGSDSPSFFLGPVLNRAWKNMWPKREWMKEHPNEKEPLNMSGRLDDMTYAAVRIPVSSDKRGKAPIEAATTVDLGEASTGAVTDSGTNPVDQGSGSRGTSRGSMTGTAAAIVAQLEKERKESDQKVDGEQGVAEKNNPEKALDSPTKSSEGGDDVGKEPPS